MDTTQFWQLIEASRGENHDCKDPATRLEELLVGLDAEEIIDFYDVFNLRVRQANRADLWAISYIVDKCSDERYAAFRFWLVTQGQRFFDEAIRNPDRLADKLEDDNCFCEQLDKAPLRAYQRKTGVEMYSVLEERQSHSLAGFLERFTSPLGTKWKDEEDLKARFPRLCEKFG